ncbi:MAG: hypothetical protein D6732_25750 [Methanobacteriota archaeon]|nr:MAG: hypothetical protein D6732_25750 [Euryarchaeota archaeon]
MFQYAFLAPLSILVNGFFLRRLSGRFFPLRNDLRSVFTESLILGTSSLIFPMVLVGIFLDGLLYLVAFSYFAVAMGLLSLSLGLILLNLPKYLFSIQEFSDNTQKEIAEFVGKAETSQERFSRLNEFFLENVSFHRILVFVNFLILFQYGILALLSPPTGWDALHVYLPNSLFFYLTDDIPSTINPLNFIYTFKPPVNSLLFTYVFYISKGFYPHLIPVLYLIGLSGITYDLALEIGLGKIEAAMASILLLVSPFMYYMMHEFIFYQDLPIAFYISAGFLYYLRSIKENSGLKRNGLYLALSFGISPLTKISGYSFPLLLILSFPLLRGKKDLIPKFLLIVGISVLLFRKASTNVYIGIGVAVILIFISVFLLSIRTNMVGIPSTIKPFFLAISIATLSGLAWLYHMIQNSAIRQFLYNTYLATPPRPFRTSFPTVSPDLAYFEHGHTVNLFTTILVVFIGSPFNLFLLPFKLWGMARAFFDTNQKYALILMSWLFTFYGFWMGYFSQASIRYLSIIMVPLSILTASGFFSFLQSLASLSPVLFFRKIYFSIRKKIDPKIHGETIDIANVFDLFRFDHQFGLFEQGVILVLLGTNYLFYYPFIPLIAIFKSPNYRWYEYHKSIWPLIAYLLGFVFLLWSVISFYSRFRYHLGRRTVAVPSQIKPTRIEKRFFSWVEPVRKRIGRGSKLGLLFILTMSPTLVQIGYLSLHDYDVHSYQEFFYYDNRPAFHEMVNFINDLDLDPTYVMVGVNIPGIEYFTQRGFIDLWFASFANISISFSETNITKTLDVLVENNIHIIISLNKSHAYYAEYMKSFVPRFPFLEDVEIIHQPVFENEEFRVFVF